MNKTISVRLSHAIGVLIVWSCILILGTSLIVSHSKSNSVPSTTAETDVPVVAVTELPVVTEVPEVPDVVVTPEPAVEEPIADAIPPADWNYDHCLPTGGNYCLSSSDSLSRIITHIVYREGGGVDLPTAPNLLQLLQNRLVNAWTCSITSCPNLIWQSLNPNKIPWENITKDQFDRLVLFIISQPYVNNGYRSPAFDSMALPLNMKAVQEQPALRKNWDAIEAMVDRWLVDGVGTPREVNFIYIDSWWDTTQYRVASPIVAKHVMFVYCTYNERSEFLDSTAAYIDVVSYSDTRIYLYYLYQGYAQ